MPYYTGSAVGYEDILYAIRVACIAAGWTLSGDILSKNGRHISLRLGAASAAEPAGIVATGGTAVIEGVLQNPSERLRMGAQVHTSVTNSLATKFPQPLWPGTYHLHVHEHPDEVFVIFNHGISDFYFLAWGVSKQPLTGTGLWVTASAARTSPGDNVTGWTMTAVAGETSQYRRCPAPFWATTRGATNYVCDAINVDDQSWESIGLLGVAAAVPMIERLPNAWNQESVLIPIKIWRNAPESKVQLCAELQHARYLRIDNFEPGDIVTLGTEQWKVYPFASKNSEVRNGGTSMVVRLHSGTFGWAIRYDAGA